MMSEHSEGWMFRCHAQRRKQYLVTGYPAEKQGVKRPMRDTYTHTRAHSRKHDIFLRWTDKHPTVHKPTRQKPFWTKVPCQKKHIKQKLQIVFSAGDLCKKWGLKRRLVLRNQGLVKTLGLEKSGINEDT